MPVITVDIGKATKEQKAALVEGLVSEASTILHIPEQAFVTLIRENDFDNIGNGTRLLSDIRGKGTE